MLLLKEKMLTDTHEVRGLVESIQLSHKYIETLVEDNQFNLELTYKDLRQLLQQLFDMAISLNYEESRDELTIPISDTMAKLTYVPTEIPV
jgi:hypothetical protein